MTVRDLIKSSMRKIGAIATGETPSAEEIVDGMSALNMMLDAWSIEGLIVPVRVREEFSITAAQASRTIGVAGNFNTARPVRIHQAATMDSSGNETPVEVLTADQWAAVSNKDSTSSALTKIYFEDGNPTGTINFWPVPSGSVTLVLYSEKRLTTFTSASTDLAFLPGYEEAMVFNLAIRLAPDFGQPISGEVATIANEAKASIKRKNVEPQFIGCDTATLSRGHSFNIYTGE